MDWKKESEMFNQAADYNDKYRPSYPTDIIDCLIQQAKLTAGSKILEIGAGSGKVTELLTNKNYEILGIDPGKDLVAIGNSRFSNEKFKFVEGRFEEYSISPNYYDMVFAAQSFHWIPQPIGYQKCAYSLKANGHLALLWNMYITYDNPLDNELVAISSKYGGFADFLSSADCEKRIASIVDGLEKSGLFKRTKTFRLLWEQSYTADEYYGFALTGNAFIQKSFDNKQKAYNELSALAAKNNGAIPRPYLCVLYLSQKK